MGSPSLDYAQGTILLAVFTAGFLASCLRLQAK
jgi:glucose-6-phosphate dehydrogenase assembly protein OpcA